MPRLRPGRWRTYSISLKPMSDTQPHSSSKQRQDSRRSGFTRFLHHPRQLWVRKAAFQIHLWIGLAVALYIFLIGFSGSVLVFRKELESIGRPARITARQQGPTRVDMAQAIQVIEDAAGGKRVSFIYAPKPGQPVYLGLVPGNSGGRGYFVDPSSGAVVWTETLDQHWFVRLMGAIHYYVLLGPKPGLMVNGIGAALLLLLTATGLFIWWPGVRAWRRGFFIDISKSWKRINYDLHNVTGFWTLAIVSFWAISGVYFAWPREFTAALNKIAPITQPLPPVKVEPSATGTRADLRKILERAHALSPHAHLAAVSIPPRPQTPLLVYLSRRDDGSLLEADYLYFHPRTGRHLATWQRGVTQSFGDWVIWAMHPVHFGTQWGLAVKVIWFLLGMSLPVLVVTGVWMYWNRYLSKKWSQLKGRSDTPAPMSTEQPVVQ